MKVIIAGGRKLALDIRWIAWINYVHDQLDITEVVSGKAQGGDQIGEWWARARGIPVEPFPADWDQHGRQAGYIRNRYMAAYAEGLIALPGVQGTRDMVTQAWERGLYIYPYPCPAFAV